MRGTDWDYLHEYRATPTSCGHWEPFISPPEQLWCLVEQQRTEGNQSRTHRDGYRWWFLWWKRPIGKSVASAQGGAAAHWLTWCFCPTRLQTLYSLCYALWKHSSWSLMEALWFGVVSDLPVRVADDDYTFKKAISPTLGRNNCSNTWQEKP